MHRPDASARILGNFCQIFLHTEMSAIGEIRHIIEFIEKISIGIKNATFCQRVPTF